MKVVKQSAELLWITPNAEKMIEISGRTCYKSEDKITDDSASKFIEMICKRQHESVLEHGVASFRLICDRGISHELVRHRLASFSQESTRYVRVVKQKLNKILSEDDVVLAYESGLSMKRISDLSQGLYTEHQVLNLLKMNDIPRRGLNNKGLMNEDWFAVIDTPEKAYLLGMIVADGSLHKGSHQIAITQHQDFSWYLAKMFRDFIRERVCLSEDKNCHQITWSSKKMYDDLVAKGVIPNKTYDFTESHINLLWDSIPPHLIPDFIRGEMDGDGSVRFYYQNNPGHTFSCNINWCGNRFLMEKISQWIGENFGYVPTVRHGDDHNVVFYIAVTQPEVAIALCNLMYANFKWPYGHPKKTCRVMEVIEHKFPIADMDGMQVLVPPGISKTPAMWMWGQAVDTAEKSYRDMLDLGCTPQIARSVLPTCLKTELVLTANFREWKHIIKMRTDPAAHPQMRELIGIVKEILMKEVPSVFAA